MEDGRGRYEEDTIISLCVYRKDVIFLWAVRGWKVEVKILEI